MMTRSVKLGLLAATLAVMPVTTGEAQRGDRAGRPNREVLEQRVRQRLAMLLKTQLRLDDEQMRQLSEVNQRFDAQRRALVRRDMETRRALRQEVIRRDSADQSRVEQLLADQFRVERERFDLNQAEQRDLARFLTPVQRAQYLAVQEQIRREMDNLRGRGMPPMDGNRAGDDSGRRRRPPPA